MKKNINNRDKPFKGPFQEKYDIKRHFNQNILYWYPFLGLLTHLCTYRLRDFGTKVVG